MLVDSYPTRKGIVWRNLVNFDNVMRALEWLKENNRLYEKVQIDRSNVNPDEPIMHIDSEEACGPSPSPPIHVLLYSTVRTYVQYYCTFHAYV